MNPKGAAWRGEQTWPLSGRGPGLMGVVWCQRRAASHPHFFFHSVSVLVWGREGMENACVLPSPGQVFISEGLLGKKVPRISVWSHLFSHWWLSITSSVICGPLTDLCPQMFLLLLPQLMKFGSCPPGFIWQVLMEKSVSLHLYIYVFPLKWAGRLNAQTEKN